jgi:dihydrofolate reductase
MCMSLDGYVTTPDGWPAQLADPAFSPEAYGFVEFQAACDAVLMGRTTFEPALGDVLVLGSHRPEGTPDHVVVDGDPARLLERVRGRDVHLVGGPRTIETFRQLGALDELGVIVLPLLLGDGMQLTPALSADAKLKLSSVRALPTGAVEIFYDCS